MILRDLNATRRASFERRLCSRGLGLGFVAHVILAAGSSTLGASTAVAQEGVAPDTTAQGTAPPLTPVQTGETCPPPDGTRPDPSLVVTDPVVLERFSLRRVLAQLIEHEQASQSPTELYQQLWDSQDTQANAKYAGPHCDDLVPASVNGFPIDCPRKEARLKDSPPSQFVPVALFNRFDLHPEDGSNCGEYRIVYAMVPFAEDNRAFVNFEGVLPNPVPASGIDACRPVVEFWQRLPAYDVETEQGRAGLASALERFYFQGLPGFEPIVEASHYGLVDADACVESASLPAPLGKVRTNLFVDAVELSDTWQLRQFELASHCEAGVCRLQFEPAPVGENPFPPLFDFSNPAPEARDFQAQFLAQIPNLASDDINRISLHMDARFNAGQSTSTGFDDDYAVQMAQNGANDFTRAILAELERLGRTDIKPIDIAELPTGLNPARHKAWGTDSFVFFPNFMVLIWEPNWYLTYHYWPTAYNRHTFEGTLYFVPPKNATERLRQELAAVTFKEYALQDGNTLEATQRMLESRAVTSFPLNDQEILLRQLHKAAKDHVDAHLEGSEQAVTISAAS